MDKGQNQYCVPLTASPFLFLLVSLPTQFAFYKNIFNHSFHFLSLKNSIVAVHATNTKPNFNATIQPCDRLGPITIKVHNRTIPNSKSFILPLQNLNIIYTLHTSLVFFIRFPQRNATQFFNLQIDYFRQ